MPTSITVSMSLVCDHCGKEQDYPGQSKIAVLREARADGWTIAAKTLCPRCSGAEMSVGTAN